MAKGAIRWDGTQFSADERLFESAGLSKSVGKFQFDRAGEDRLRPPSFARKTDPDQLFAPVGDTVLLLSRTSVGLETRRERRSIRQAELREVSFCNSCSFGMDTHRLIGFPQRPTSSTLVTRHLCLSRILGRDCHTNPAAPTCVPPGPLTEGDRGSLKPRGCLDRPAEFCIGSNYLEIAAKDSFVRVKAFDRHGGKLSTIGKFNPNLR